MLFQNILVPIDLSTQSRRAFKVAFDIAKKYQSRITLLTCLELGASDHLYYVSGASSQQIKKQSKVVKKHHEKLKSLAEKINIPVKSQILISGSAVNNIASFAKSRKHDLIVIGSHSRTGFDKLLLGSVANGVSHKAKCPVLIVK